jgi:hypothetical protein
MNILKNSKKKAAKDRCAQILNYEFAIQKMLNCASVIDTYECGHHLQKTNREMLRELLFDELEYLVNLIAVAGCKS